MYKATVEGGSFKSKDYGWANNTQKMNSKSSNDFRWSVKLIAGVWIGIGIASNLQPLNQCIANYDEHAIIYHPLSSQISKGKSYSGIDLAKAKLGDAIGFRFQAQLKKFSISLVC